MKYTRIIPWKDLFSLLFFFIAALPVHAQTPDDILNLLIENNTITREEADSLRAEAAIKKQATDAGIKSFPVIAGKAVKLSGYGHIRYQYLQEEGKNDGIDIRRAYVDIKGDLTPYWSYRLQTDFAGTPRIVDIYSELKINDYLNFTIGQQLIPFSLNSFTSNTKLELADRALAVEAFSSRKGDVLGDNNGRDIGISVYGSFFPVNNLRLVEYRIGIFNGSGINKADLNEAKDVIGRLLLHPMEGLDIGGSFYAGWTPDSATLNNKTAPGQLGLRQRFGAEISYVYKFMGLKAEYLVAEDGHVKKNGYYALLSAYALQKKLQLVCRYDAYDKNTDNEDDLATNFTFGANYFIHSNALLQAAFKICGEEGIEVENNVASLQFQISF